jgi:hypothetical protein
VFNHRRIHRFDEYGELLDDRYFAGTRQTVLRYMVEQMKEKGYVRRLEIDDDWTLHYNGSTYKFQLSVYGTYVGKRNAECLVGLLGTRPIYIQNNKSEVPLTSLASE